MRVIVIYGHLRVVAGGVPARMRSMLDAARPPAIGETTDMPSEVAFSAYGTQPQSSRHRDRGWSAPNRCATLPGLLRE
jgi:hypothetical protein